jgi:hypothetical protein
MAQNRIFQLSDSLTEIPKVKMADIQDTALCKTKEKLDK